MLIFYIILQFLISYSILYMGAIFIRTLYIVNTYCVEIVYKCLQNAKAHDVFNFNGVCVKCTIKLNRNLHFATMYIALFKIMTDVNVIMAFDFVQTK